MKTITDKETSAFHARFCPFADRIYRNALIVTGNPQNAERLQVDVYLKAFVEYLYAGTLADFKAWLVEIVRECFAEYKLEQAALQASSHAAYVIMPMALAEFVDCKKRKSST